MALAALVLIRPLPDAPTEQQQPIDWLAAALALTASGRCCAGLSLVGEYRLWAPRKDFLIFGFWRWPFALSVAPVLAVAGGLAIGLWALERRSGYGRARGQAFQLGLLRNRRFVAGATTAALYGAAISGLFFAAFVYIPFAFELKSLATSIAVLPFNLASLVGVAASGLLLRWLVPRYVVQGGLIVSIAGTWLLLQAISVDGKLAELLPGLIVLGAGSGLVFSQVSSLTLSLAAPSATAESSGILNALQDLGGSLGTALLGALLMVSVSVFIVQGVSDAVDGQVTAETRRALVFDLSETLQHDRAGQAAAGRCGLASRESPASGGHHAASSRRRDAPDAARHWRCPVPGAGHLAWAPSDQASRKLIGHSTP